MCRGGSWYYVAMYCRAALSRDDSTPVDRYYDLGFRLARFDLLHRHDHPPDRSSEADSTHFAQQHVGEAG